MKTLDHRDRDKALARFRHTNATTASNTADLNSQWQILKTDFLKRNMPEVPDITELPESLQRTVREYLNCQRIADELMSRCDSLHQHIASGGADEDTVEDYASARDAFEDAVENFGMARDKVAKGIATFLDGS